MDSGSDVSGFRDDQSAGGVSRFTLASRLSNANKSNLSQISKIQNKVVNSVRRSSVLNHSKSPLERLKELTDSIDLCSFLRVNWLMSPMINSRQMKHRVFNLNL